jgi:hypothetical protein
MQDNPRYHRQIYRVDRVLFVERLSELTLIVPSLESFKGSHQGSVAWTKSQLAESREAPSPSQDWQQTVETNKVRESRRVQTDSGLRRKTSSDDCAGKVGECTPWEDSPLRGKEPVVLLPVAPIHPIQSRFAWRTGARSRLGLYQPRMLSRPSVIQTQRKVVPLRLLRTP